MNWTNQWLTGIYILNKHSEEKNIKSYSSIQGMSDHSYVIVCLYDLGDSKISQFPFTIDSQMSGCML